MSAANRLINTVNQLAWFEDVKEGTIAIEEGYTWDNWETYNPGNSSMHVTLTTKNARAVLQLNKSPLADRRTRIECGPEGIDIVQGKPENDEDLQRLVTILNEDYGGPYDDIELIKMFLFYDFSSSENLKFYQDGHWLYITGLDIEWFYDNDKEWHLSPTNLDLSRNRIQLYFKYMDMITNITHGEIQ